MRRLLLKCAALTAGLLLGMQVHAAELDHNYAQWDSLAKKHVRWLPDNKQSRVNYAAFATERAQLKTVLSELSAVTKPEFDKFSREQQMAFYINAYNAFTVELILTKYPDLKSIKDLGGVLSSPWKKKFFTLLGEERTLDWIEHEQLRVRYQDPRIHAAIVCASIGCPALRNEAFTAAKLDAQLADGMQRFLGDKTRNRFTGDKLEVSAIFKWFKADFEKGDKSFASVDDVFAFYASALAANPADVAKLKAKGLPISYLDYDWSLNDVAR